MHRSRLLLISLLVLGSLLPLASSKLFSAAIASTPAIRLPVLSSDEFIKKVHDKNADVQSGLDTALAKLLGTVAPPPASPPSPAPANASADTSQTAPSAATAPSNPSTPNTPTTSGFNQYSY